VESICACQSDAEKAKKEAEDWLEEKASYYINKNTFLDRKGGPHGH
jgi:post-segregation antitoxin (ccd killing protein)